MFSRNRFLHDNGVRRNKKRYVGRFRDGLNRVCGLREEVVNQNIGCDKGRRKS